LLAKRRNKCSSYPYVTL